MADAKHSPGPWQSHPIEKRQGLPYVPVSAETLIARVYSKHFGDDDQAAANGRLIAAAPELLEALRAIVAAQAMSSYGDSSDFVWPVQTMRKPGEHAYGYLCPTHGLGYTSSCVCCRDEYERHVARKDRQAAAHRDGVLKAASEAAVAAIAKVTGSSA